MTALLDPSIRLENVVLTVRHLVTSIDFYENVVGLRIAEQTANEASFTADGKTVLLKIKEVPDAKVAPQRSAIGLYHFALLVPSRKALAVVLRRLIEKQIRLGQADHLVSEALYFSDPDGHGIEVYCDRPRDTWTYDTEGLVQMDNRAIDLQALLEEADGVPWEGVPKATVLGHIHLHVNDLVAAKRLYVDGLGFQLMSDWQHAGAQFVATGGYHHHVAYNLWAGTAPLPKNSVGLLSYSIVFPTEKSRKQTLARLTAANIPVQTENDGSLSIQDPAGVSVILDVPLSMNRQNGEKV
ncbi:VOC family protein [Aureibacillus halotolerans]|uniref:Catechol 2,3-dioxygenase n=1 Tax=Aureibacillus halotolerans TaxID=1508390 RepID=A0A4R6U5Q6_9BACI|nr:VOC family protein [Aureibacillus halotolerans]TDQ40892.1 catechol 2,3-dioxygenase [Aureibacillus halotolerans]